MYTIKEVPIGGGVSIGVCLHDEAVGYGLSQWSLQSLRPQERLRDQSEFQRLSVGLCDAMRLMDITTAYTMYAYAEVEVWKAKIVREFPQGDRMVLSPDRGIFRIKKPGDGVFLKPAEAFVMATEGCPLLIASADEYMVVAHARHIYVVEAAITELLRRGVNPAEAFVMATEGCPLLIASADEYMVVAHARHIYVVEAAITELLRRGVNPDDVRLWMQPPSQELELAFTGKACQLGIRMAWTTDFVHTEKPGKKLIMVKRSA